MFSAIARRLAMAFSVFGLVACVSDGVPVAPVTTAEPVNLGSFYELGAGDVVSINVYNHKDLSGDFAVDESGRVALPLVGEIAVAGKSVREAEDAIELKLSDGWLVNPSVNVQIRQYRPFYVIGGVLKPGAYPFTSGMNVLNAIALAGGHDKKRASLSAEPRIIRASDPQRLKQDVAVTDPVYPGDIVEIPESMF